jgi:PleD family two-component response regulator
LYELSDIPSDDPELGPLKVPKASNLQALLHKPLRESAIMLTMARVLVVDDEPAVRRALERALKLDNYEVELAADGEEALDVLA